MKNFSPETLQEALDLWRKMGDLNKDGIKVLVAAVEAGEVLANVVDSVLNGAADGVLLDVLDDALDEYIKVVGEESDLDSDSDSEHTDGTASSRLTPEEQVTLDRSLQYAQVLYGPGTPPPAIEYAIEIVDQGFEPGTYGGWTIQFKVEGLPRLSYQKADPVLEAFIRLERAEPGTPRLASGGSSALARTDEGTKLSEVMMGGGQEGNVLRGFTGAAVVEVAPVVVGNAPVTMPSDEVIAKACRVSIDKHLVSVAEEAKRLAITENVESIVGRKMTVK